VADLPIEIVVGVASPRLVGGHVLPDLHRASDGSGGVWVEVGLKAAGQPAHLAAAAATEEELPGGRALVRVERWSERPVRLGQGAAELITTGDRVRPRCEGVLDVLVELEDQLLQGIPLCIRIAGRGDGRRARSCLAIRRRRRTGARRPT
jgi:hypothetical protein